MSGTDPRISDKFDGPFAEFINGLLQPGAPLAPKGIHALGIRPDLWLNSIDPGKVTYIWPNNGSRDISDGRAFGGWIAALSDHVVSICMFSALTPDEHFTTQDLQIKFFRPLGHGDITIRAEVKNKSRSTGYVEAEWFNSDGKLATKVLAWKAIRPKSELQ